MGIDRISLLSTLKAAGSKGLKTKDIVQALGVRSGDLQKLREILSQLESEGTIMRGRRRRYQLPGDAGYLKGTIFGYGRNVALFVPSDGSSSLLVAADNLGTAHSGDTVIARTVRGEHGEQEAQVMRVLAKGPSEIVGHIAGDDGGRYVHVDHGHRHKRVAINRSAKARSGDYVVVRVNRWGESYERTRGRVTEVLGGRFSPGEDFAALVKEFKLPLAFPRAVVDEVKALPREIPESEIARREDLRSLLTFTIDPADAKDFDDAISIEDLGRGRLRVGVHIADVSHYVKPRSMLDYEAMARGRSIYLVDRVIPMLPQALSGDLATLKAEQPRLAVSVLMDVAGDGEVERYTIKDSVIESKAKLTYDEAQSLIEKGAGWRAKKERKKIAEALKRAEHLRGMLRKRRVKRGAIELATPEVDITLDSTGRVMDIKPTRRLASHNLIEEMMIIANETVANHMAFLRRMFMYRVHEVPDEDDMRDLAVFAGTLGHRFRWTKGTSPMALQALRDKVRGKPEEYIVSMFILRSLKKAQYAERNVGHFGLASKCYTHFTSPIRRYPDLVVHRLLKRYGYYNALPKDKTTLGNFVRQAARIASAKEIEGDEAERAWIKSRVAEFMEDRVGEEYWGVVSGVTDFGFFVMLEESLVEGLVHVSTLGDDYYTLDSTRTMLIGTRTARYFRVGDRVKVKVTRVDRGRREVDFVVIGKEEREAHEVIAPDDMGRAERRRRYRAVQADVRKSRSSGRKRSVTKSQETRSEPASGSKRKTGRKRRSSRARRSPGTSTTTEVSKKQRALESGRSKRRKRPGRST